MRTREERDQQTVEIATALAVFALVVAAGGGVVYLLDRFTSLTDRSLSWSVIALLLAAAVVGVRRLVGRR